MRRALVIVRLLDKCEPVAFEIVQANSQSITTEDEMNKIADDLIDKFKKENVEFKDAQFWKYWVYPKKV